MRHGLKNVLHQVSTHSHHPVQNRLENWEATRDNLKLTMQRNIHGLGAPAHTLMERKIVSYVGITRRERLGQQHAMSWYRYFDESLDC